MAFRWIFHKLLIELHGFFIKGWGYCYCCFPYFVAWNEEKKSCGGDVRAGAFSHPHHPKKKSLREEKSRLRRKKTRLSIFGVNKSMSGFPHTDFLRARITQIHTNWKSLLEVYRYLFNIYKSWFSVLLCWLHHRFHHTWILNKESRYRSFFRLHTAQKF